MSTENVVLRRLGMPGLIGLIALGAIAAIFIGAIVMGVNSPTHRAVTSPDIQQAHWKVRVSRAGASGKLSQKQKSHLRAQRPRVTRLVQSVYGAMFLDPERLKPTLDRYFTEEAARTLMKQRVGPPNDASDVQTLRRSARIAIDVSGATRATALVTIVARGRAHDTDFRITNRSELYMTRSHRNWRVIGFHVTQTPSTHVKGRRVHAKERNRPHEANRPHRAHSRHKAKHRRAGHHRKHSKQGD